MPRIYPPAFGKKLAKLHPRFCKTREVFFGTMLDHDDDTLGLKLFESLPWHECDWWKDGDMLDVFMYLRGSTDLQLGSLRPLFPSHIFVCD